MASRWVAVVIAAMVVPGCSDEDPGVADTDGTESSGTGPETSQGDTMPPSESTGGESDGLDDTSTDDGPMSDALVPCDPRDTDPCSVGVCSGTGYSGFYCRPGCSSMAEPGSPCGADDVCLSDGFSDALACFDVQTCDFVTGDGCPGEQTCAVLSFDPVRTGCVPGTGGGLGTTCGPAGALACDVGLGCLGTDLDGDDPGGCQQWCVPGDPLPDGCPLCVASSDEIGTCAECSVLEQDCPDGQACQPINELLAGVCIDHGSGQPGEACMPFDGGQGCEEGSLCFEGEVDDAYGCVATCDPLQPMCPDAAESCLDVGVLLPGIDTGELGLCIEGGTEVCDPDADPTGCAAGEACLSFEPGLGVCGAVCDPPVGEAACEGNAACIPTDDTGMVNIEPFIEGNGACGAGCLVDSDCGAGTCLLVADIDVAGVCGETCTPGAADCVVGQTCVPTPADEAVGACIVDGATCDDPMLGDCAGNACVVLDGGAGAVCMTACFEQNPLACGGAAEQCHVKTEARWHDGICIGGGPVCDVVAQDCGPGMACGIVGGGAIGGAAFACNAAGQVAQGGDCSKSDCDAGLLCLGDVCRAPCDPANDQCAAGTCQDASAQFYLPADTVGICL